MLPLFRFTRLAVATLAVAAVTLTQTAAMASPACQGCDLYHEGSFGPALVGTTVYYQGNPYLVQTVDPARGLIQVSQQGVGYVGNASLFYSAGAEAERQSQADRDAVTHFVVATVMFTGFAAVACMLFCDDPSSGGSVQTGSQGRSQQTMETSGRQREQEERYAAERQRDQAAAAAQWERLQHPNSLGW